MKHHRRSCSVAVIAIICYIICVYANESPIGAGSTIVATLVELSEFAAVLELHVRNVLESTSKRATGRIERY